MKPLLITLSLLLFAMSTNGHAAKPVPAGPDHWVGTWTTANFAVDGTQASLGTADTTYREIVHLSIGGPLVRVTVTNEFGTAPLTIASVHLALAGLNGDIALPSANAMTFGGKEAITLQPGAVAISDPAALLLPAGATLAVSLFIPAQPIPVGTFHGAAHTTSYMAAGNVVGKKTLVAPTRMESWYFLKAVEVKTVERAAAIVAFGDSITDGTGSTLDGNDRWPDVLATRLHHEKKTEHLAVLNAGIGGNLLLRNAAVASSEAGVPARRGGTGPSALSRFDAQVLALSGVKYLIVLEGINDIGHSEDSNVPTHDESIDDLIQGYAQLIERAHAHGIKVFVATLPPYQGAIYASPAGEQMRVALNGWIRSARMIDGVIDFDSAMRDPANPDVARAGLLQDDHLHPTPVGYKVMGETIDLKLFTAK